MLITANQDMESSDSLPETVTEDLVFEILPIIVRQTPIQVRMSSFKQR